MSELAKSSAPPTVTARPCWICGDPADSGEHKAKRSDLKATFPDISSARPIYFHDGEGLNRPVSHLDDAILKWRRILCHDCNTRRTQPHDLAWERLQAELRKRLPTLNPGDLVNAEEIFADDPARALLGVHLYFLKEMGCTIVADNVPLDIGAFAKAIMTESALPEFFLEFGLIDGPDVPVIQAAPVRLFFDTDGKLIQATWFYNIEGLVIEGRLVPGVTARAVGARQGAWHPSFGTNSFRIVQIEG